MDKSKKKDPGIGRIVLSALVLGVAILIGFVAGLRSGKRGSEAPPASAVPTELSAELFPGPEVPLPETDLPEDAEAAEADEPEKPEPAFSRQQVVQGVEYLASHNHWNRREMEKIPVLQGLWDAVNTYKLDEIRGYNEILASTPLTQIVEGLERAPKQGYYVPKGDQVITLSTYIKRMR